ncbi:MAG TPA: D-glycero-beta-D-manno-heptose 1-phosphate adenylyltransferase [Ignavibacteria bacterium]|nr:D-glycero-beta-D-manno-heptose 1-phosphate adenylyltransferase [Ignavibacteria bacterium]HRJ99852.1 D-glycero-beta-D-manno-heptose 1-phosphate adenylyltransferase [Ignavibacteria bacterium]
MILKNKELSDIRKKIKEENKKLVFTNGCFDILHKGHVSYLNQAKLLGDYLIVGVNSDSSVKKLKGDDRPVNSELDRAFILDNLKSVDYVTVFNEDTPYELIKLLLPDCLVKGGDWKEKDIVGSDIVKANKGKVVSLNFINNYSSSSIIDKIRKH